MRLFGRAAMIPALLLFVPAGCGTGPDTPGDDPGAAPPKESDFLAEEAATKERELERTGEELSTIQARLEDLSGVEETEEVRAEKRALTKRQYSLEIVQEETAASLQVTRGRLAEALERERIEEEMAKAAPAPEPEPTPEPEPEPEPVPGPEPEPAPEPEPGAEPMPEPDPGEEPMPGPESEPVPGPDPEAEEPPPEEVPSEEKGIDRYNSQLTFDERWEDIIKRVKLALERYRQRIR